MSQQFNYPATDGASPLPITGTVTADQGTPNTAANAWPVKVTDGTDTLAITAAGEASVIVAAALPAGTNSIGQVTANAGTGNFTVVQATGTNLHAVIDASALPSGAATAADQATGNASLSSIDGKTLAPGQAAMVASSPVVIASDQSAIPVTVASVPLPTGAATEATLAAFSAKTAGALVPQAYDYQAITYVGVTTDIDTVVYKTGGAGGTTVATLTMGYDGSSRLTSVTRT